MSNLVEMLKDKKVTFLRYRKGDLWYSTECGFEFPVPIADVGDATLLASDRAPLFMRYVRKHLATLAQARAEGGSVAACL